MRTGTTDNWSAAGTAAIDDLERSPYFKASVSWGYVPGDYVKTVDGCIQDENAFTSCPAWLTAVTDNPARISYDTGHCQLSTLSNEQYAFLVLTTALNKTSSWVVRAKYQTNANMTYQQALLDLATRPSANVTIADNVFRSLYYGATTVNAIEDAYGGAPIWSNAWAASTDYVMETEHDATNDTMTMRNASTLAVIQTGSYAHGGHTNNLFWYIGDATTAHACLTRIDYMQVLSSLTLTITDIETGYTVKLYDAADVEVASGEESGGEVALDVGTLEFPFEGYFKVYNGAVEDRRLPSSGTLTDIYGGDTWPGVGPAASQDDITEHLLSVAGRTEYEDSMGGLVPTGAVVGDVDISMKTGSLFSSYNTSSPLYDLPHVNRDTNVYAGFTVGTVDEYLSQFTGITSDIEIDSAERVTNIHALDKGELLRRKQITWPLLQGVTSDYVIRSILGEAEITEGLCYIPQWGHFAGFNGTKAPSDNAMILESETNQWRGTGYAADKWSQGSCFYAGGSGWDYFIYDIGHEYNYGSKGHVVFWSRQDAFAGSDLTNSSVSVSSDVNPMIGANLGHSNSVISYTVGTQTGTFAKTLGTGTWHLVGLTWDTTNLFVYAEGSLVGSVARSSFPQDLPVEKVTITPGATYALPGATYSGTHCIADVSIGPLYLQPILMESIYAAESRNLSETNIESGYNTIGWLWVDEKNAWELIKEVCEAEAATFHFDGEGKAHFQNRYHHLGPDHATSQKTIAYNSDVMNLRTRETADGVINRCVVKASPLQQMGSQEIWSAQSMIKIPKNGTIQFWADFNDPVVTADTSFNAGTSGTAGTRSEFYAFFRPNNWWVDMSSNVGLFGTLFGKSMKILGTNKSTSRDAWLVDSTGAPRVSVWGVPLKTVESEGTKIGGIYAVNEDSASIGSYGEKSTEIDNPYISTLDYADNLSKYMVQTYATPRTRVEGVSIMGDPRLEPGDKVTLQDSSSVTGINGDFWLLGYDWNSGPPYTQELKLQDAANLNFFILDHGTYGRLDYNVLAY